MYRHISAGSDENAVVTRGSVDNLKIWNDKHAGKDVIPPAKKSLKDLRSTISTCTLYIGLSQLPCKRSRRFLRGDPERQALHPRKLHENVAAA